MDVDDDDVYLECVCLCALWISVNFGIEVVCNRNFQLNLISSVVVLCNSLLSVKLKTNFIIIFLFNNYHLKTDKIT